MKTDDLVLRCMAERTEGQWVAMCIDLCLAAQADTLEEARQKLECMIEDYVAAAYNEDREHATVLLNRKAPLRYRFRYHYLSLRALLHSKWARSGFAFSELLPMSPGRHCHV